jgi:hypothetical protein
MMMGVCLEYEYRCVCCGGVLVSRIVAVFVKVNNGAGETGNVSSRPSWTLKGMRES